MQAEELRRRLIERNMSQEAQNQANYINNLVVPRNQFLMARAQQAIANRANALQQQQADIQAQREREREAMTYTRGLQEQLRREGRERAWEREKLGFGGMMDLAKMRSELERAKISAGGAEERADRREELSTINARRSSLLEVAKNPTVTDAEYNADEIDARANNVPDFQIRAIRAVRNQMKQTAWQQYQAAKRYVNQANLRLQSSLTAEMDEEAREGQIANLRKQMKDLDQIADFNEETGLFELALPQPAFGDPFRPTQATAETGLPKASPTLGAVPMPIRPQTATDRMQSAVKGWVGFGGAPENLWNPRTEGPRVAVPPNAVTIVRTQDDYNSLRKGEEYATQDPDTGKWQLRKR